MNEPTQLTIPIIMEDFLVSATQVSTFELCNRKWAWRYIEKVEAPSNKFAVLGVETHGHLERWLKFSIVPVVRPWSDLEALQITLEQEEKSVKLAQALIPLLPPPQAVDPNNVEIDQVFKIHYDGGTVKAIVKSDLFMPKWRDDLPTVYDHKTGGNEDYWLTPDRMVQDIQATLYAGWALTKIYTAPAVDLQWNYARTKGAIKTLPVVARVNGRAISERLGKTVETARIMEQWANSPARALDYPYNALACEAYGGCPYKDRCNLQPIDRMRSVMSQQQPITAPATRNFVNQLAGQQAPMPPPNGGYSQPGYAPQPVMQPPGPPPAPSNQMINPPSYNQAPAPQQTYPAPGPLQVPQGASMAPPQQQPQPAPQPQYAQQQLPMGPPQAPPQAPHQQYAPAPQPQYAPQQQAALPPAPPPAPQPAPQESTGKGRGRPNKVDASTPWVAFACAALSHGHQPQVAGQIADMMLTELANRNL